jgi:hypothetical protein
MLTRIQLYKEAGQETGSDIEQPDSTKLDYIDNDNNNRAKSKAMALKSLDEFIAKIPIVNNA